MCFSQVNGCNLQSGRFKMQADRAAGTEKSAVLVSMWAGSVRHSRNAIVEHCRAPKKRGWNAGKILTFPWKIPVLKFRKSTLTTVLMSNMVFTWYAHGVHSVQIVLTGHIFCHMCTLEVKCSFFVSMCTICWLYEKCAHFALIAHCCAHQLETGHTW